MKNLDQFLTADDVNMLSILMNGDRRVEGGSCGNTKVVME